MSELFLRIVNLSISASFLVLAVVLLRPLLRKAPRWLHVLLWALVAVRLLCPFSIESAWSLIPSAQTVSPEIMLDPQPQIQSGIPAVNAVINPVIGQTFAPDPTTSANPLQILIPVAAIIWLCGIGVMLLYSAVSYWLLYRRVATAVRLRENIFCSERVTSPFVLGILRPRVYLPFSLDEKDAAYVIAHEHMHIARKDHWWKPLGFLLLSVYWFNPFLWLGYILLCRDIELACDEKVIGAMERRQRADYSEALLRCSARRWSIAACPLAFGEVGIKGRVKNVLRYKKPAFWLVAAALVVFAVLAVCFLTNPPTVSLSKITGEDGYTVQQQNRANLTLTVPKSAIPESAYTQGYSFAENEVIVYQTDTTSIWLSRVQPANEGDDKLYFMFDCSYVLPDSGRILLPYWKENGGTASYGLNLNSRDLCDENTVYPDTVSMHSHGPGEEFSFYVDTAACKAAQGSLQLQVFCVEVSYVKNGTDSLLLSQVHDRTYLVTEVVYRPINVSFSFVPGQNTPSYGVTDTFALVSRGEFGSVGWTEVGSLKRTELTMSEFGALFVDSAGWQNGMSAGKLVKQNTNAWHTRYGAISAFAADYYLLQQQNGDVYMVIMRSSYDADAVPEACWVMKLAVDTRQSESILAVSGSSAAVVGKADAATPLQTMIEQAQTLSISFEDPVPFEIYAGGENVTGLYSIYDAETLQKLDYMLLSGLEQQCSLFQNAQYGKQYLITLSFPGTSEEVLYFLAALPPEAHLGFDELKTMTLEDVIALSKLGMTLTWEDLAPFAGTDIGSGLYVVRYQIDGAWSLLVGDGKTTGTPMYANLLLPGDDGEVDIRQTDVAEMIQTYNQAARDMILEETIRAHFGAKQPDGLIHSQSWVELDQEVIYGQTRPEQETVYLLIYATTYSVRDTELVETGGSFVAVALTFDIDAAGQYRELIWWEPRDGGDYADDLRNTFPEAAAEAALRLEVYAEQLQQTCLEKAQLALPNHEGIETLLQQLVREASPSSDPNAYIAMHSDAYLKLVSSGEETLRYCFSQFLKGWQTDLRGQIMALCCRDIMLNWGEGLLVDSQTVLTGQDWFDYFSSNADSLSYRYTEEELEKYYPASWLLLQLKKSK